MSQKTSELDALGEDAGKAIELIKERRSIAIFAAVTGKIDLRVWKDNEQ